MNQKRKLLSLITALTITTSAFTGFAAPVNAAPDDSPYVNGDFTLFDDEITENPTEAPTAAPTAEPTTAPILTGDVVYVDETFDDYTVGTIIKSGVQDDAAAPAPVTLGKIVYAAGRRVNGPMNTLAEIKQEDTNKYLFIDSDGYSTNSRGISFTFAEEAGIPTTAQLGDSEVLELSMEVESTDTFELTGFGTVPAVAKAAVTLATPEPTEEPAYSIVSTASADKAVLIKGVYENGVLKSVAYEEIENVVAGEPIEIDVETTTKVMLWDSLENMKPLAKGVVAEKNAQAPTGPQTAETRCIVRAIIDKANNKQYLIITNSVGEILSSTIADLTATGFTGATFYTANVDVAIDNLKIEKKSADTGLVNIAVKDNNNAPLENVTLTIGKATYTTDADGMAAVVLPNGEYTVVASKAGYEHTATKQDNDIKEFTVNSNTQSVDMLLSVMSYVKLPDTVTLSGGQVYIAAPKNSTPSQTEAFTVEVKDQYGLLMTDDEYRLEWAIYPHGSTVADDNVTIDSNGVVSVAQSFSIADEDAAVAEYDVTVAAFTDDRNNKVTKTLYIGKNDIVSYMPVNYTTTTARGDTVTLSEPIAFGDMVAVTLNMDMTVGSESNSNSNIALLNASGSKMVGLQLQSSGVLKAWTGWTGSSGMNQSSDVDTFTNSATLIESYTSGTKIDVTFTFDNVNKKVTVSCGDTQASLDLESAYTELSSVYYGNYRETAKYVLRLYNVTAQEPDTNYLAVTGDVDFAKISGQTIEKTYNLSQSVVVPDEEFAWTVKKDGVEVTGVTIDNTGKLTVADTAAAGEYVITATSTTNAEKTADLTVQIADFQQIDTNKIEVSGPVSYNYGSDTAGSYSILKAVDSFGDDVADLLPAAKWTSSNTDVATITETGELTVVGAGKTTVTATITNGTAVTTVNVEVTVGTYFVTAQATGDTTSVDTSSLAANDNIVGYQVTTAKDGVKVKQEVVTAAPVSVDTTGADSVEIAPVYQYAIGQAGTLGNLGAGYVIPLPNGTYNFNVKVSGQRCDVYANKQMLVNNILQGGSAVDNLDVNDIVISEGMIKITGADYGKTEADSNITVKVVKAPSNVTRTTKMYVLGDSLACIYYNGADATKNYQTGWGQVLQNYVKDVEVVDLANSGATANGLMGSAFTQVLASAKAGDYLVLESGYNDRTYDTQDIMKNALNTMIEQSEEKGVTVILVSPNASVHDYKASVSWTSVMAEVAEETETGYIDLSKLSYEFLYATYGDDTEAVLASYNVSDKLHSTYNGAHKWAAIVAKGLADLGYTDVVNTEYKYSFTDSNGNTIDCQAK